MIEIEVEKIRNKKDFIEFVRQLRMDFKENKEEWENDTLENYLEAFQAAIEAMDNYYINNKLEIPKNVPWNIFAEILETAKYYE
ncbi:DUF7660 family protein [Haliovirga abyssi]|uniref:DUF7660 domain-containing protein n=1 Tax=Haliovirga abyssi TaxID=2996794 RepID=A0AAU9DLC9_9FUSO|nr:hypothetical protein [Haliovirga abyssi]BDU51674.1 hypothetical protein HLVA_22430 [Haliovirga abyssi]